MMIPPPYDGTENDRDRFFADEASRTDAAYQLLFDERVMRLMYDPIYVGLWRNTVRAYVTSNQIGSNALIASLIMLTLASLDQYARASTAGEILSQAFAEDEPLFPEESV